MHAHFVFMTLFKFPMQVPMYVGCAGRSTSIITAFRHTSGHTEVRRLRFLPVCFVFMKCQKMTVLILFFLSWQYGPKIIHFLCMSHTCPFAQELCFYLFIFGLWIVLIWVILAQVGDCEQMWAHFSIHLFIEILKADSFFSFFVL